MSNLNFIESINEFGNTIYDKTIGVFEILPGSVKGLVAVVMLFFMSVGLFAVFKKSLKAFFIILAIVVIAIIILNLVKQ